MSLDALPFELRLIVWCLRTASVHEDGTHIQVLCRRGMDWDSFVRLVDHHRVISPVYQKLKQFAGNCIPKPVLKTLRDGYRRHAQQVLAKTGELVRIVKKFQERGIPVLPFKGPVLSLQAYGELVSRHVGDLDIMVPPEQALVAQEILLHQGYHRTHPDFELTQRQALEYLKNIHHFGYFSQEKEIRVELHWRFGSNRTLFPLDFNALWKDKQTLQLGGVSVATPSLENTMLLLCVHGAQHAWFRLFWVNDITQLMAKNSANDIDWGRLMRRADRLGIERMVAEGVILANLFFGAFLPEPVRVFAEKDKNVRRLLTMAQYLISISAGPAHRPLTQAYAYMKLHSYLLRKDIRYKIYYCLKIMGPSVYDDWQRFPLPDKLFPLYSLLRPFTWIFRWFIRGTNVYQKSPTDRKR